MSPAHAYTDVLVYGIGLGSGRLKEGPEEPPEEPEGEF
jgi:hypothetical protein